MLKLQYDRYITSCEHDLNSSSSVCHAALVLACVIQEDLNFRWLKNNALRWQTNSQEAFLAKAFYTPPEKRKRGPSLQVPPLHFACFPRAAFKKNSERLLCRLAQLRPPKLSVKSFEKDSFEIKNPQNAISSISGTKFRVQYYCQITFKKM